MMDDMHARALTFEELAKGYEDAPDAGVRRLVQGVSEVETLRRRVAELQRTVFELEDDKCGECCVLQDEVDEATEILDEIISDASVKLSPEIKKRIDRWMQG
jgi:hypothetical protein